MNPSVTGQTITATAGFTVSSPGSDSPVAPTGAVEFEISLDGGIHLQPHLGLRESGNVVGRRDRLGLVHMHASLTTGGLERAARRHLLR